MAALFTCGYIKIKMAVKAHTEKWDAVTNSYYRLMPQRGQKPSVVAQYVCMHASLCWSQQEEELYQVRPPSHRYSFRVLPWWQAGIQWQTRLTCVHACVFPAWELKGAAAKGRLQQVYVFFFVCFVSPSSVTPTPLGPAAKKPASGLVSIWVWYLIAGK